MRAYFLSSAILNTLYMIFVKCFMLFLHLLRWSCGFALWGRHSGLAKLYRWGSWEGGQEEVQTHDGGRKEGLIPRPHTHLLWIIYKAAMPCEGKENLPIFTKRLDRVLHVMPLGIIRGFLHQGEKYQKCALNFLLPPGFYTTPVFWSHLQWTQVFLC